MFLFPLIKTFFTDKNICFNGIDQNKYLLHDKLIHLILIVLPLRHDQMIQQIFHGSIETSPDEADVSIDSLSLSWSGDLFV